MKDLLDVTKTYYEKSGKSEEEIGKIQYELEKLYYYSQKKWWLPFGLQVRFCEPYRIGNDLFYVEEIINKELESFDIKQFSSTLIRNEFEKQFQNNKIVNHQRLLIKTQILKKYSPKKSAAFLMRLIKDEYYIQRRRWWLGMIIGWFLGVLTVLGGILFKFILDTLNKLPEIKDIPPP